MGQGSLKNIGQMYITHLSMEGIPLPFSNYQSRLVNKVDNKLILTADHFTLTQISLQISYQKVFALGSINSSKMHQTKTVGS